MFPPCPLHSVLEPLVKKQPVRQAREYVVEREVPEVTGCHFFFLASLRVDQVRGRDVGQRLRRNHVLRVEITLGVPVQVQGAQPAGAMVEREGENGGQPALRTGGRELREPAVRSQSRDGHGLTRAISQNAWPLPTSRLHVLEKQGGFARRRH